MSWIVDPYSTVGRRRAAAAAAVWVSNPGMAEPDPSPRPGPAAGTATERGREDAGMERAEVMRWVDGYERAWRDGDLDGVARLFTEDARYRRSPYEEPDVGHDGIRAFWLDDDDGIFTVSAELVAVEGRVAVVRLEVGYGDPVIEEYRDLWVLRFAGDGRVEDFEEWPYRPGQPYAAPPS